MSAITDIHAREIFDSRGNPTLEVIVEAGVARGVCSVPSGASTGIYEAHELRDEGERLGGMGVRQAVSNVEDVIRPSLKGTRVEEQEAIDATLQELDGTQQKERLGANALLGVSIASAKAAAFGHNMTLSAYVGSLYNKGTQDDMPFLFANVINGGKHAGSGLSFQEFMVVPQSTSIDESIEIIFSVQHDLRERIEKTYGAQATGVGDEGGFAPPCATTDEALTLLYEALGERKARVAIDVAASSFWNGEAYVLDGATISSDELCEYYVSLAEQFPLLSLEDPFHEDDFMSHSTLRQRITPWIIGDDLTVTNARRIQEAIDKESIDGSIIKPNQIGTLTETCQAARITHESEKVCIASHRSGETNDDFIVDISIGLQCYGLKLGALQRGERIAKYNRFLELYGA